MTSKKTKSLLCKFCKKSFSFQNQLLVHVRQHTGEKPFVCRFCSKDFASIKVLRVHERIHTGEKPYKCPYCNKRFSAYANLVVHRRIHTNEKPYHCKLCRRAFEHSGNLNRHIRAHLTDRGFRCILCSQIFEKEDEILNHTKTDHKSEYLNYIQKSTKVSLEYLKVLRARESELAFIRANTDTEVEPNAMKENTNNSLNKIEGNNISNETNEFTLKEDFKESLQLNTVSPENKLRPYVQMGDISTTLFQQKEDNKILDCFKYVNNKLMKYENLQGPTVASEYWRLKHSQKQDHENPKYEMTNDPANFIEVNKTTDNLFSSDPPPLIPIDEIENIENNPETKENPQPIRYEPQWGKRTVLNDYGRYYWNDSYSNNVKLNDEMLYSYAFTNPFDMTSFHCPPAAFKQISQQKEQLTNFWTTEISNFTFRKKVENVLILLFGKPKLEQFGYLHKSCEQVRFFILIYLLFNNVIILVVCYYKLLWYISTVLVNKLEINRIMD